LPFPKQGYWAASELKGTALSLKVFDPPGVDNFTLTSIFTQCSSGRCLGGPEFECELGYDGPMCFQCKPNQFYWMGTCKTACENIEPRALITVIGIVAVVFVWYIFYLMTSGTYVCICIVRLGRCMRPELYLALAAA
jgi:hypothetical protein